jgi:hypothetical protein
MTLQPGKVVLSNPLTCTNTAKGDNKLYSDAKGVVPSLDLRFAEGKTLNDYMTGQQLIQFSRSSIGTYVDENGIIQTAIADQPRFDHDPTTGESLGLLVEESRTNSLTNSEHINTGWLYQGGMTAPTTTTAEAPDGGLDARLFTSTGGRVRQDRTLAAAVYTLSVYYKPNTDTTLQLFLFNSGASANVTFDTTNPSNPTVSSGSGVMVDAGGGWFRASVTTSAATDGAAIESMIYTDSGYLWGAQLEAGSFPTSYIPTTGTALTRSADVASISGSDFSSWYNQSEGTVFTEYSVASTNVNHSIYSFTGSTDSERIYHYFRAISTQLRFDTQLNGTIESAITIADTDPSVYKTSYAYKPQNIKATFNGLTPVEDNVRPGNVPININQLLIGTITVTNVYKGIGHIARLTYFPERLPDSTLQAITT